MGMTRRHILKAKLCLAGFYGVSGHGAAPPYIFGFLLPTSTKLLPALSCGPSSVLYQLYSGAAPLRTSFEPQLP